MGQTFIRELLVHTQGCCLELPFPDSICFVYLLNLALKDLGCWGKARWAGIVQALFVILGLCPPVLGHKWAELQAGVRRA